MVVGLFAFILYGLVAFGSILATKQRVTSAAADGARASVGAADFPAAQTQVTNQVETKLGLPGTTYTQASVTYTDALGCAAPAACIKVTIVYNLPASPGLGIVAPATTSASAVVRYK